MKILDLLHGLISKRSPSELTDYLQRWILHGRCPVCQHNLDATHSAAHVGSCNFPGPNPQNGFLQDVMARNWPEVVHPFERLSSMDLMACEVIECPKGFALLVWVEVDLVIGGDQYAIHTELIKNADVNQLEKFVKLQWMSF